MYRGAKNMLGDGPDMIELLGLSALIIGFVVATISAALAVKWLVGYLSHHGVAIFGWYRLLLAAVVALMISRGMLTIAPLEADTVVAPSQLGDATPRGEANTD